jgi:hypothetical protein
MNTRWQEAPTSALPLAYFAFAHVGLAAAFVVLLARPELPGGVFYQPRVIALVHLVTLVWLSGSILGAFHIVAPLALRLPLQVRAADWAWFAAFVMGAAGMISHFWLATYDGMAWSAGLVVGAIAHVANGAFAGLRRAPVPWPIKLHVYLAFVNVLAAALLGILIGLGRSRGFLPASPLRMTYAHAHLAAIGWAVMMVVGLAYRLIPMMVPAAMPAGRSLALSAIFMQTGVIIVVCSLVHDSRWLTAGALAILAGIVSFVVQIARCLSQRRPRPPALPRRDWSVWQAHAAIAWLVVAAALGMTLTFEVIDDARLPLIWWYGIAGLVGFLAQMVAAMQGRLVPLYAWYRATEARGGTLPVESANGLPSAALARIVFLCWTIGVPSLAWGLASQLRPVVVLAAVALLGGVATGGLHIWTMCRRAQAT